MAKARAIVKRRKAVRNIRKITKTMQMIATAKFQKSLKRAVGTKPFTLKVRELVSELADSVGGEVDHPLLRKVEERTKTNRITVLVVSANRGLAGAYNGNVLRTANAFIKRQEAQGKSVDLYVVGKKGVTFFNYQKRAIKGRFETNMDNPKFAEVERGAQDFMQQFIDGQLDAVYVGYMNFISTGVQKPEVMQLLPRASVGFCCALDLPNGEGKSSVHPNSPRAGARIRQRDLPKVRRSSKARNRHDGYLCRLVLVLSALLRSAR